jgi:DNA-directed RNA polymerase subunit RPC12/RpoP
MIKVNLLPSRNILAMRIDTYMKPYLVSKIEKLTKKAIGFGLEPMELTFGPDKREEIEEGFRKIVKVTCVAKLVYDIPIIDGWELICTFDIVGMKEFEEVFISKVPSKTVPVEYQKKDEIHCDHCGHRRFRNHSMLMRNVETGEYKEVGSTCVKDFFGHNPQGFMFYARFTWPDLSDCQEVSDNFYDYNGQGYRMGCDDLKATLAYTSGCIKEFGWVSAKYAMEWDKTATKHQVQEQLNPPRNWETMKGFVRIYPTKDDANIADDTIEYFKGLSEEELSDNEYLWNCHKIAKHSLVPWKFFGFACSMINAYQRYLQGEIEKEKRSSQPSDFVGQVGDRLRDIKVTCVFLKELLNEWTGDTKVLYIWLDEQGNKYKTFYSGYKWHMYQGDTAVVTGTVKNHDVWNGEKSTLLTRCAVTDVKEPVKAA